MHRGDSERTSFLVITNTHTTHIHLHTSAHPLIHLHAPPLTPPPPPPRANTPRHSKVTGIDLADTVEKYVDRRIANLDLEVGALLTRAMLSHITIASVGIHSSTLNAVLSLDADVQAEYERLQQQQRLRQQQQRLEGDEQPPPVEEPPPEEQPPAEAQPPTEEQPPAEAVTSLLPPLLVGRIRYALLPLMKCNREHGIRTAGFRNEAVYATLARRYEVIYRGCSKSLITAASTNHTLALNRDLLEFYARGEMIYNETVSLKL